MPTAIDAHYPLELLSFDNGPRAVQNIALPWSTQSLDGSGEGLYEAQSSKGLVVSETGFKIRVCGRRRPRISAKASSTSFSLLLQPGKAAKE